MDPSELTAIVLVLRRPDFAYEWKLKRIQQKLRRAGCPRPRGVGALEVMPTRGSVRALFVGGSEHWSKTHFRGRGREERARRTHEPR